MAAIQGQDSVFGKVLAMWPGRKSAAEHISDEPNYPSGRMSGAVGFHEVGDIVFTRDPSVISALIRVGQKMLSGRSAQFSHVAICMYPGLFVHSVPGRGVEVFGIEEKGGESINFDVKAHYKPVTLRLNVAKGNMATVLDAINYWLDQKYSYRFLERFGARLGSTFCSQFIAQILEKSSLLSGRVSFPTHVTPASLYDLLLPHATDVSAKYYRYQDILKTDAEQLRLANDLARNQMKRAALRRVSYARTVQAINNFGERQIESQFREAIQVTEKVTQTRSNGELLFRPRRISVNDFEPIYKNINSWLDNIDSFFKAKPGSGGLANWRETASPASRLLGMIGITLADDKARSAIRVILEEADDLENWCSDFSKIAQGETGFADLGDDYETVIAGRLARFNLDDELGVSDKLASVRRQVQGKRLTSDDANGLLSKLDQLDQAWRRFQDAQLSCRKAWVNHADKKEK